MRVAASARRAEAIAQGRRAAVVHERALVREPDERRDLERAARADVDSRRVRVERARVTRCTADGLVVEDVTIP